MTDLITVTGLVATTPRHIVTSEGLKITTFRLASSQRKFDRKEQKWVDGETNWFTITAFRQLAVNVLGSVQKGQRIVVTGRLRVRDWETDEKKGTNVEIDAEALGHDLTWGTAAFTRSISPASGESEQANASPATEESGDTDSSRVEAGSSAEAGGSDGSDESDESDEDSDDRPAVLMTEPAAALPF